MTHLRLVHSVPDDDRLEPGVDSLPDGDLFEPGVGGELSRAEMAGFHFQLDPAMKRWFIFYNYAQFGHPFGYQSKWDAVKEANAWLDRQAGR